MSFASGRVRIAVLLVGVALLSGGTGFYFGFGRGAGVVATIASQDRVGEALSDVRRSMEALSADDTDSTKRKIATDLRISLFTLDASSSSVPFMTCRDQDRKALAAARSYITTNPYPQILNGDPALDRGLKFCGGRGSQVLR